MLFKDFWPIYLELHSKRGTQWFHTIGLMINYFIICCAVTSGEYWYCLAGPMFAYAFAFSGHFWVEHNKPATFHYSPIYSLMADHVLLYKTLTKELS